jgi:maleate isomerase
MNEAGLAEMMTQVLRAAREVAVVHPKVIVQCGAPGTFLRGHGSDDTVIAEITKATGIPATTMHKAQMEGLKAVGAKRVAVATVYTDAVNEKLKRSMEQWGFEVVSIRGLQIEQTDDAQERLTTDDRGAYRLGRRVFDEAKGKADSILISCGGYLTFDIIPSLELDARVPVVSSNQASLWQALRIAGINDRNPLLGQLFTL